MPTEHSIPDPRRSRGLTVKGPTLGLALLAVLAGNAGPQDVPATPAPPAFPARVEQVTVDVVVTDGEGAAGHRPQARKPRGLRGRGPPGDRELRSLPGARGPARRQPDRGSRRRAGAVPALDEHGAAGAARAQLRDRLRRRPPRAPRGAAGQGGDRGVPEEGDARGRPRDAAGGRRRRLVDGAHGRRPRGAPGPAEAPRGAAHAGVETRLAVRLRGHAHPRLPRQQHPQPGPAPFRDLRPDDHDRAEPARPGPDGGRRTRSSPRGRRRCTSRPRRAIT